AVVVLAAALAFVSLCLIKSNNNAKLLKKQFDSAIEANSRRTGFFSSMVHELKMPLSIILGAAQLIEMKRKSERQDENGMEKHIAAIKCNCYRMMRLTGNLLDLARSEAGYLVLKPVNCDLCRLLEEIVRSVRPYAMKKQIGLVFRSAHDSIVAAVDIEKMERIMLNLLSNAIKFTDPGGSVIVSAYSADGRVFISVKDTGVGIPPDRQNDIFGLYSQAGIHSAEKEGSGIGLYLVKAFAELHHGNVRLISEEGKGSEFIVDLPSGTVTSSPEVSDAGEFGIKAGDAVSIEFSGGHSVLS
ncbi:MAG TPA: HAMP domain-containing sensor histidine kinase, partial [Clostridiales bacterium]|nr:HAMP domain-containing sensor histidine kinase [Clostridiales bacterium]HPP36710.1 HAMP domain-containing sensor histidine kinase [Clostridiales bacterium]